MLLIGINDESRVAEVYENFFKVGQNFFALGIDNERR